MDQIKIGKYIAGKRKDKGMTQVQLAETLGVTDKSVSKWERGICLPDVSNYTELCKQLDISLNEFFAGEDIPAESILQQSSVPHASGGHDSSRISSDRAMSRRRRSILRRREAVPASVRR